LGDFDFGAFFFIADDALFGQNEQNNDEQYGNTD
jgi:hypothetical protein